MKFILGKKIEMSQIFDEKGFVHPVTWLLAGPVVVTDVRTKERDGYEAVQVGFSTKSKKSASKAEIGHFGGTVPRIVKEFKGSFEVKKGDTMTVSQFEIGEHVSVSGAGKGKGFQGVVKRHGFKGGSRTHGQKLSEREPGSIGSVWPQRILKGLRMAGRMGGGRITTRNLEIVKIIPDQNLLAVEGSVPGHRGSIVEIRTM